MYILSNWDVYHHTLIFLYKFLYKHWIMCLLLLGCTSIIRRKYVVLNEISRNSVPHSPIFSGDSMIFGQHFHHHLALILLLIQFCRSLWLRRPGGGLCDIRHRAQFCLRCASFWLGLFFFWLATAWHVLYRTSSRWPPMSLSLKCLGVVIYYFLKSSASWFCLTLPLSQSFNFTISKSSKLCAWVSCELLWCERNSDKLCYLCEYVCIGLDCVWLELCGNCSILCDFTLWSAWWLPVDLVSPLSCIQKKHYNSLRQTLIHLHRIHTSQPLADSFDQELRQA